MGSVVANTYYEPRVPNLTNGIGLFLAIGSAMGAIFWLLHCAHYTHEAKSYEALALTDRKSRSILRTRLECIRLIPWPFRGQYGAVAYRERFYFTTTFYPITVNPQMIPLSIRMTAGLDIDSNVPDWFVQYIKDMDGAHNAFCYQAFDILQHQLPHELANRLNPYDPSTAKELRRYMDEHLRKNLPFPVYVEKIHIFMKN